MEVALEKRMVGTAEDLTQKFATYADELQIDQFMVGIRAGESIQSPLEAFSDDVVSEFH